MHTYLYRAERSLGPLNEWTQAEFEHRMEPLGSVESVKEKLDELFPDIDWRIYANAWCGGSRRCGDPYVDIMLGENSAGLCNFIVLNKMDESAVRRVMTTFRLNYACKPESGALLELPTDEGF